jgi:two-component system alkaline phosphatase synthesis response regulator PhoP
MGRERLLVIDAGKESLELICSALEREGFDVSAAQSGEDGLVRASSFAPELAVIAAELPGIDGFATCRILRRRPETRRAAILLVASSGDDADVIAALEQGADDCLPDPGNAGVLVARVKALLRRKREHNHDGSRPIRIGELYIDAASHIARAEGRRLELTLSEFRLLHHLARHPGWVFTREQLLDQLRGADSDSSGRAMDLVVMGLRRKLGHFGHYIETVRGVGYRLNA